MQVPEGFNISHLLDLLIVRTAHQLDFAHFAVAPIMIFGGQEGVYAHQRHAAAFGDAFELLVHGFFHQVGEFIHDEAALPGVLAEVQAQFLVDDPTISIMGMATARRTDSGVGVVMASS